MTKEELRHEIYQIIPDCHCVEVENLIDWIIERKEQIAQIKGDK